MTTCCIYVCKNVYIRCQEKHTNTNDAHKKDYIHLLLYTKAKRENRVRESKTKMYAFEIK